MTDEVCRADPQPKSFRQRVIELAARWYVFWFLNVYGLGKIAGGQFYRRGRLPEEVAKTLLGEANAFDLAWTFMGYSFAYILFIGLAEVVGAWLLLWERTKLLGVAVLLPVMVISSYSTSSSWTCTVRWRVPRSIPCSCLSFLCATRKRCVRHSERWCPKPNQSRSR